MNLRCAKNKKNIQKKERKEIKPIIPKTKQLFLPQMKKPHHILIV